MIERVIWGMLEAGIEWFSADTRRVSAFFRRLGLSESEAAGLRAYYAADPAAGAHGGPPTVIHGFPRQSGPFPCWAVILAGDPIKQMYLGDDLDGDDEDLDGQPGIRIGSRISVQIDVESYAQDNPDIAICYYHMLRHVLWTSKAALIDAGCDNLEFSGRDIQPQQRFLPENIWIRSLRLTADVDEAEIEQKTIIRSVDGALVEGGPEDDSDENENLGRAIVPYVEVT